MGLLVTEKHVLVLIFGSCYVLQEMPQKSSDACYLSRHKFSCVNSYFHDRFLHLRFRSGLFFCFEKL